MMWKWIKFSRLILISYFFSIFSVGCQSDNQKLKPSYLVKYPGYYYKLLAFDKMSFQYKHKSTAWINVTFKTQNDSVFWDSFTALNDAYFVDIDSTIQNNILIKQLSLSSELDSVSLLINTKVFFKQQFFTENTPFFSQRDSVVKVNYKIKQIFNSNQDINLIKILKTNENRLIQDYLTTHQKINIIKDSIGIYWIEMPKTKIGEFIKPGDLVSLEYCSYFLNGQILEKSPLNFEYVFGTPDQLLKGLNYVISRLKKGQNAKILLPSRLTFGENGSSNKKVARNTPLVYELKILDLKQK